MGLTASIVGEIHVLLAAALMFVVLPWWALSRVRKKAGTGASTLAAGFSFWIVAVTVLAYVNSLRYSVLFVIVLLAFVAAWRVGARAPVEAPAEQRGRVWDVFERPRQALDNQMVRLRESWQQAWRAMHSDYGTVGMVLAGAAMLWALVYGSWPWLHQADPGTPQGYANLLRIASFTANTGVYPGGAAPVGRRSPVRTPGSEPVLARGAGIGAGRRLQARCSHSCVTKCPRRTARAASACLVRRERNG